MWICQVGLLTRLYITTPEVWYSAGSAARQWHRRRQKQTVQSPGGNGLHQTLRSLAIQIPKKVITLGSSVVGFRLVILLQLLLNSVWDGVVVAEFHREAALALAHALELRVVVAE